MATINYYLNFKGNAEEAFNFYKSAFGGEFNIVSRFKDTPHGADMSEADLEKMMHISLPIGNGNFLMASDVMGPMGQDFKMGNNFCLSIQVESEAEADQLFNALSAGGKVTMPLQKTFWSACFGMFDDKFGIQWMINYDDGQAK